MKRPPALSFILFLWFPMLAYFLYGVFAIRNLTVNSVWPDAIALVIFSLVVIGIFGYFFKVIYDLWRGKRSAVWPMRIIAIINLLNFPIGTILSVVTFIVLSQSEVKTFLGAGKDVSPLPKN